MNALPSLPTDNLYKFCAIIGLVLMGASVYSWVQPVSDLRKKRIDWQRSFDRHVKAAQQLGSTYHEIENQLVESGKLRESPDWRDERNRYLALSDQEAAALADLFADAAKYDIDGQNLHYLFVGAIAAGVVGLFAAFYGFRNWRKLQLLQDKILIGQASGKSG